MSLPLRVATCLLATAPLAAQFGWTTPTPLTTLNTPNSDNGPCLSADGLSIYFASFNGDWEIYSATRAARGMPWSAPVLETALGDPTATDFEPCISGDGLEIYFGSSRSGGAGGFDIVRATRPTPVSPWGTPTFVLELNTVDTESSPSLTGDSLEIFFLGTGWGAPSPPNNAIIRAVRTSTSAPFGTPAVVAELANANTHRDVHISYDGLTIYYTEYDSAARRLHPYIATRPTRSSPFGAPQVIASLDSFGSGLGLYSLNVSRDGTEAILAATVPAGGSYELHETRFEGLAKDGIAAGSSTMNLVYRDTGSPGLTYVLALALGNTGFPLGTRTVPLDPDPLFLMSFGAGVPPLTSPFAGALSPAGEGSATVTNPFPFLAGIDLWVAAFTLGGGSPFGVKTISNALPFRLQ